MRELTAEEIEERNAYTDEVWAYLDCQMEDEMIRKHEEDE
tara:strand:+ start:139 stop:258 length:120 start_codon:yes stop_codon:yes gene_type:complete